MIVKRDSIRRIWEVWRRWLTLGMGIKRWLLLLAFGALLSGIGVSSFLIALRQWHLLPAAFYQAITLQFLPIGWRILISLLVGGGIVFIAILRLGGNLVAPFRRPGEEVGESLYNFRQRNRGPRVVAIGGGTGMPGLLRGLSQHTSNITAIVTVADDGGSSGRLRREFGLLPPGDFRNNIAALAGDEALMTQLLQYRFGGWLDAESGPADYGNGHQEAGQADAAPLQGHAFGNLLLAALTGITGSFDEALLSAGRVLAMSGQVLPSTTADVTLVADVSVGNTQSRRIVGESAIPLAGGRIERVVLEPADVAAYPPAVRAILQADLVVIGPGSLYTSILPNLLVPGLAEALRHTRATRLYICNLATQPGETDNYDVADHVAAIHKHLLAEGDENRRFLDLVLANDNLSITPGHEGQQTVYVQPIGSDDLPMMTLDLVDEHQPWRHDSHKLAQAVMTFVNG